MKLVNCIFLIIAVGAVGSVLLLLYVSIHGLAFDMGHSGPVLHPTPTGTPLSAPDITEIATNDGTVTLHWKPVADATLYGITYNERGVDKNPPEFGYVSIDDDKGTRSTSYTVEGLKPGIVYTFRVYARGLFTASDGLEYTSRWGLPREVQVRVPYDDGVGEESGAESHE